MAYSGIFKPKHPKKYRGDPTNIQYRSMWENSFMMKLDNAPNIVWWQSEEVIVPYTHPVTRHYRRYFPDFVYEVKGKGVFMVEIKPAAQCKVPKQKPGAKSRRRLITESKTFLENQAKWESARRYCAKRGWQFQVLTEKELGQWA